MNESASVVQECVPVSVSKEKKDLFYTNRICTPECQEGTPPCFLCTGYERYKMLQPQRESHFGGTGAKYKISSHQAHAQ